MTEGSVESSHQRRCCSYLSGVPWGVLMLSLMLLLQVLPRPATAGDVAKNAEPFFFKTSSVRQPIIVFPPKPTSAGGRERLKKEMIVGMCKEDRMVPMKKTGPLNSAIPKALPIPTPKQIAENTVEDMMMVMKEETDPQDPIMAEFEEMVTSMNNTKDEINSRTSGGGDNTKAFQDRVRQFLGASGIDAILPLDCGRNPLSPDDPLPRSSLLPWVAALGSREDGRFHYRCTGVVISHFHILTDADCVSSPNINVVQLNVTGSLPEPFAVENYVVGRRTHPSIRDREDLLSGNNIGILELAFPLEFNDYVQPVCIPGVFEDPDPEERSTSTVVGFDNIVDGTDGRTANLYTWPDSRTLGYSRCFLAIRTFNRENPDEVSNLFNILTKKHICVDRFFELVGKSAVLRVDERTGRVRVLGVAGVANAFKTNPIAYTYVQQHRFWIEMVVKKFRDNTTPITTTTTTMRTIS